MANDHMFTCIYYQLKLRPFLILAINYKWSAFISKKYHLKNYVLKKSYGFKRKIQKPKKIFWVYEYLNICLWSYGYSK